MTTKLDIIGLCGSLRRESFNRAALHTAVELAPTGMTIAPWDRLREIPPYDEDVRLTALPEPVADLVARIAAADGLLIATPEYNHSIPGVLKNAIDWASRAPRQPFAGKPIAIMGASPGGFGTVRGQAHLRQSLAALNGMVMNAPEALISHAGDKVAGGALVHQDTRAFLKEKFLPAFAAWIQRLGRDL